VSTTSTPPALPTLHTTADDALDLEVDALVVPVFRGAFEAPGTDAVLAALGLDEVPRDASFRGRLGETLTLAAPGLAAGRVVLVGLGRMDELSPESLRRAAGAAGRLLAESARTAATTLPLVNPGAETVRAVAEGFALGAYRFLSHRSAPDPVTLTGVTLVVPSTLADRADELVRLSAVHARAQSIARDLVNLPSKDKTPQDLCDRARALLPDSIEVEVWDVDRLREERCGGVLAVGQGSDSPPRMLVMRYRPETALASVALVGKGITFDSGGLSLKRPNVHMEWMKADMGGAAAVIGAMSALPDLHPHVEVLGVCGVAENMPSGDAQRPSDVFTARNGTTVEVLNTDAEGRLVLADALSYAAEQEVDAIVDLATLTGAALVAVGKRAAAAMSNDDDVLRQILRAAEAAGEPTWHLPLWDDLREGLDSEVADLTNINRRTSDSGGTIMAGLFLREFVDGTPWVHLDIAGPAFADEVRHHLPKGGTGAGVRTILRWLEETGRH
jgi:leucyl aminopeptidase